MNPTHPTALSPAPHGTPTLLDVRRLVTFGPDAADRFSGTNEGVSSSSTTRGTVMMVIGLLMILATVLIAVLTEDRYQLPLERLASYSSPLVRDNEDTG